MFERMKYSDIKFITGICKTLITFIVLLIRNNIFEIGVGSVFRFFCETTLHNLYSLICISQIIKFWVNVGVQRSQGMMETLLNTDCQSWIVLFSNLQGLVFGWFAFENRFWKWLGLDWIECTGVGIRNLDNYHLQKVWVNWLTIGWWSG